MTITNPIGILKSLTNRVAYVEVTNDVTAATFTGGGAGLTNLTYLAITNGYNTGNIALGQEMFTNLTGSITLTGFSGKASGDNLAATAILIAYGSGGDRTVTLPTGCLSFDNVDTYTVTNGQFREFHFTYLPNHMTNCSTVPAR